LSEKKEIEIKRIATPQGDIPTVDSVMEALNIIVNRINTLSKNFSDKMKYSGASIEASGYIEQNLIETNQKISELKKNLTDNSDKIEQISADLTPQSKSYQEVLELKNMTKSLKENITELQKSLGEGYIELNMLYWEHNYATIEENLNNFAAYEPEKMRILGFFKILNLSKPVIDNNTKILLYGPNGVGKSSLIRAIAKDQRIKIIELNLPLILSLKPSRQVENLNKLFHYLRYKEGFKPCVLLLDNFELIHRIQDDSAYLPFIETLIVEIGRIYLTKEKILVIAILNNIEYLDKRFLEQFNEKIELKLPDQLSRSLILRKFLNEVNLETDIDLDELSSKLAEPDFTEGFSGNDLRELFNIAKLQVFTEGRALLNGRDLENAIQVMKKRKAFQKVSEERSVIQKGAESKGTIQHLEEELATVKILLTSSTRMLKHALRLALTDNYNFINRLYNHYEATKKPFTMDEIAQVTGMPEENVLKMVNKMPYRLLFPKMGEQYYLSFDKTILEEILAEMALAI
jgi:SpoVK/Ycf46/Vps4 family AAA+-type ATPase